MQLQDGSVDKVINNLTHVVLAASFAGIRVAKIIPHLRTTDSGRVIKLEKFPYYVGKVVYP
ncbi:hypothetical protein E2542_SST23402 [Spatholobus suberectus]|nr:hypothetical protein E2542_SST23402 [Spatholobus suberectus]